MFLKPSGRPELSIIGLAMEVLAACVGEDLGLPVCEPILVDLESAWVDLLPDAVRRVLARSNPVAFGSLAAGEGWRPWSPGDRLAEVRRPAALAVFAFDAFIENPDRKPSNPNLLVRGDALRIIDHELALMVRGLIPPPEPWKVGYASLLLEPDRHVFAAGLKGKPLDLAPVRAAWSVLSDDRLEAYEAAIPPEWADAADAAAAALRHLQAVRDRIDECLAEIGRALS